MTPSRRHFLATVAGFCLVPLAKPTIVQAHRVSRATAYTDSAYQFLYTRYCEAIKGLSARDFRRPMIAYASPALFNSYAARLPSNQHWIRLDIKQPNRLFHGIPLVEDPMLAFWGNQPTINGWHVRFVTGETSCS